MKAPLMDRKQFATVDEASRILGVDRKSIYRWIYHGLGGETLPAKKFGGTVGIHRRHIERFAKQVLAGTDCQTKEGIF